MSAGLLAREPSVTMSGQSVFPAQIKAARAAAKYVRTIGSTHVVSRGFDPARGPKVCPEYRYRGFLAPAWGGDTAGRSMSGVSVVDKRSPAAPSWLRSGDVARTEYEAVEKRAPGRTVLALELAEALEEPGGRARGAGLLGVVRAMHSGRDPGRWEEQCAGGVAPAWALSVAGVRRGRNRIQARMARSRLGGDRFERGREVGPVRGSGLITVSSVVWPTQAGSGLASGRVAGSTETTNRAEPSVKTWPLWMIEAPRTGRSSIHV